MNPAGAGDRAGSTLPLAQHLRVIQACDRFEKAWRAGQQSRPPIEDLLAEAEPDDRRPLLLYLLSLELSLRRGARETPAPQEYYPRFPGLDVVVDAAFTDQTEVSPDPAAPTLAAPPRGDQADDWDMLARLLVEDHSYARAKGLADALLVWFRGRENGLRAVLVERGLLDRQGFTNPGATAEPPGMDVGATFAQGSVRTDDAGPATVPFPSGDGPGDESSWGDRGASHERYQKGALHGRGGQADIFRAGDLELNR